VGCDVLYALCWIDERVDERENGCLLVVGTLMANLGFSAWSSLFRGRFTYSGKVHAHDSVFDVTVFVLVSSPQGN
jgi:hypothetical protein